MEEVVINFKEGIMKVVCVPKGVRLTIKYLDAGQKVTFTNDNGDTRKKEEAINGK